MRAQNWGGASVGCPNSPKLGESPLYYCAWLIAYIHNICQKLYPLSDEVGMLRIIMVVAIAICVVDSTPLHGFVKFYHCSSDLCNMAPNRMKERFA